MMVSAKKSVLGMKEYVPPTAKRRGMLRLDFNENTRGCSPKVLAALKEIKADDVSIYPDYSGVSKMIAGYVGNGIVSEQTMITNGSDEAIKCIMDTYVECGDEVVMAVPTFDIFRVYATVAGAKIVGVPYGDDMEFPLDEVVSSINERTKVVVIVNPNNPTGTAVSREGILKVVKKAKDSVVLIDEAYLEYYGETCADLVAIYDNVFVIRTFSKAFGLAGLRIGYVLSDERNIASLLKVRSPYSIGADACIAVGAALDDVDFVRDYAREVKKSRKMLFLGLSRLGVKCYPSSANFVLADFGKDADYVWKELFLNNILTRRWPMNERLKNCIRIGAGTSEEAEKVLLIVEAALSKKEAFIFDVDGVLVDVSGSYRRAVKETCEFFLKSEVTADEIQKVKNSGGCNNDWDLSMKIISLRWKNVLRENIVSKFQELYMKYRKDERWLISRDVIDGLSKRYRLGIFSGRPREELIFALRESGMEKYFNAVVAMEDVPVSKGKPEPFGLKLALRMLGCSKGFYAGDTVDDVMAAKGAGLVAVGVLAPLDKSDELKGMLVSFGADFVVDDVNDVLNINGAV
ncbi:MAG: histidinol-phosphate transaminase [archaeon]